MLDVSLAYELKRHKEAWINLVMSLGVGLFAAWIGIQLAQS
jgi:CrcB protein